MTEPPRELPGHAHLAPLPQPKTTMMKVEGSTDGGEVSFTYVCQVPVAEAERRFQQAIAVLTAPPPIITITYPDPEPDPWWRVW